MKKLLLLTVLSLLQLNTFGQAGDRDTTFLGLDQSKRTGYHTAIGVLSDGKIVTSQFNFVNPLVGINPNGTFDSTFDMSHFADGNASRSWQVCRDVLVLPDDRFYAHGRFFFVSKTIGGVNRLRLSTSVARFMPDGTIDSSFTINTTLEGADVHAMMLDSAGNLILVGEAWWSGQFGNGGFLLKLDSNGIRYQDFGGFDPFGSEYFNGITETIGQFSDGKYLVGGAFTTGGFISATQQRLVRCIEATGRPDSTWNIGTGFNNSVRSLVILPNDKILVTGNFTMFNGSPINRIARLHPDGSLDTTFNVGTGLDGGGAYLAVQADGKILITGEFNNFNGSLSPKLVRLNTDGSWDSTFLVGQGIRATTFTPRGIRMKFQPDGKLLVSGVFSSYNTLNNAANNWGVTRVITCSHTNSVQTVNAFGSYTWIDGNTYTSNNDTVTYTYQTAGGCDSTITLNLTIDTINTWNGTVWSAGQAPQGENAVISGNLTNTTAFTANNLTINNGISLSFAADEDLTVNGDLVNDGTIDIAANTLTLAGNYSGTGSIRSNGGDIVLNGTGDAGSLSFDQTTDGTTNTVANFTLNRTTAGEVSLANKLNITNQLVLTNGVLNTAGFVHLKSTSATATATVVGGTNASINGNVTAERFLPWTSAGNNGFRFVSHPLASNPVINTVSNLPTANNTLVGYNEGSNAYEGINNRAATWPQGIGYGAWTAAVNTLSFTGALQLSDVSAVSMGNAANRWNFAGNPFPSTIDWDALTTTDMQDAVWVWVKDDITEGGGAWASYVEGVSANGGSRYIAPMQGFMVRALNPGTPSIAYPAAARVSNQAPSFQRTQSLGDVYRVKVTKAANNSAMETVIRFRPMATASHDAAYDAEFMSDFANATPDLYTTDANGVKYSINALPELGSAAVLVPLQLETFGAGDFSFTFDASQLVSGVSVQLEDTKLGTFTHLVDGQVVNFSAAASDAVNRFRLHFNGLATSVAANNTDLIQMYAHEGALYIRGTERAESLRILDISGRTVYSAQQLELDGNAIRPNLAKGTYLVQLVNEMGVKTVKVIF